MKKLIEFKNVSKVYNPDILVLQDLNFSLNEGEFLFIVGPAGSGKSTLLKLITMEELPSSGEVIILGNNTKNLSRKGRALLRRKMGLILENLKLLQDRSVIENVILPLEIDGIPKKIAFDKAKLILNNLGISGKLRRNVEEISFSEAWKVSMGRALIRDIDFLLIEEPLEILSSEIYEILKDVNRNGVAVLVMTRDENHTSYVPYAKIIKIERGRLIQ